MQFTIPQFIERETKILGPLTFKQFAFFGVVAMISVFLYFILPFFLFLFICIGLAATSFALVFYKKEGIPLYHLVIGAIKFKFKTRIYLWKKEGVAPKFFRTEDNGEKIEKRIEEKDKSDLKISRSSHINDLLTQIETKE